MKEQPSLFDLSEGIRRKEEGLDLASRTRRDALAAAKLIAMQLAARRPDRTITIDDIQEVIIPMGINLGPAAGSVFRGRDWEFVGTRKTKRKTSHARPVSIWRLR
jgi:hypothetical protein